MSAMKCVTVFFQLQVATEFVFVKLQTYTVNLGDRVCGGICFYNVQTFTINGSDKVYDGVLFSEASGHYYEQ